MHGSPRNDSGPFIGRLDAQRHQNVLKASFFRNLNASNIRYRPI